LIAGIFWVPIPIVAGFIAMAAPSLHLNIPAADMVGPMVAANLLGLSGAILVFIVVFAALASSLDSLLAATGDLILQDLYKGHFNKQATDEHLQRMAKRVILGLGLLTWLLCLPRLATLASLLQFLGAFVASTIWPIIAGLFWSRATGKGAIAAMLGGTTVGLIAYVVVGFYVAALMSAAVSMVITLVFVKLSREEFDWALLNEQEST